MWRPLEAQPQLLAPVRLLLLEGASCRVPCPLIKLVCIVQVCAASSCAGASSAMQGSKCCRWHQGGPVNIPVQILEL